MDFVHCSSPSSYMNCNMIFGDECFHFKNTKNLFIHIALIPIGDSPRDITTF